MANFREDLRRMIDRPKRGLVVIKGETKNTEFTMPDVTQYSARYTTATGEYIVDEGTTVNGNTSSIPPGWGLILNRDEYIEEVSSE